MSGYRDDLQAARERIEVLERDLSESRLALAGPRRAPQPAQRSRSPLVAGLVAITLTVSAATAALIVGASSPVTIAVVLAATLALAAFALFAALSRCVAVAAPNEVLVIAGRPTRGPDGATRGYRLVTHGRAVVLPILEQLSRLDTSAVALAATLDRVHLRGDAPTVKVRWTATVHLAGEPPRAHDAVERFLGRSRDEIAAIAQQIVEGALRGTLAQCVADDLRREPLRVADEVLQEAELASSRLGIVIDAVHVELVDG